MEASAIFTAYKTGPQGLTDQEANNRRSPVKPERSIGFGQIIKAELVSPLPLLLIAASSLALLVGDWLEFVLIFGILFISIGVSGFFRLQSNRAVSALKPLLAPTSSILRSGRTKKLPIDQMVEGDVMVIRRGTILSGDVILFEAYQAKFDCSLLTGESEPVTLKAGDRVGAGCRLVAGEALGVVVAISQNSSFGKIEALVARNSPHQPPIVREVNDLLRPLVKIMLTLVVVIFLFGIVSGQELIPIISICIALLVAAVPEGLLPAITLVFAVGLRRLSERGTIVRELSATETMGAISTLCFDKTGTLTTGQMRVVDVISESSPQTIAAALFTFTEPSPTGTEAALFDYAQTKIDKPLYSIAEKIVFDSSTKWSGRLISNPIGNWTGLFLGAFEVIGQHCFKTESEKEQWEQKYQEIIKTGRRVLALAQKSIPPNQIEGQFSLNNCQLVGLIVIEDILRPGAVKTVAAVTSAGIRPLLITGDNDQTALAVARACGLECRENEILTHNQIAAMDDRQLAIAFKTAKILARAQPEDKVRVVNILRGLGEVVGMVGDGINDAPALKQADIGIAVSTATDVTKEASDIILLRDDLGTIIQAVEEGRRVRLIAKKSTGALLTLSLSEILVVGLAFIFGWGSPLTPVSILWLNLVTDGLPAIALAFGANEFGLKSHLWKESLSDRRFLKILLLSGGFSALCISLIQLVFINHLSYPLLSGIIFATLGFSSLAITIGWSKFSQFGFRGLIGDRGILLLTTIGSSILIIVPLLSNKISNIIGIEPLSVRLIAFSLLISLVSALFFEWAKRYQYRVL